LYEKFRCPLLHQLRPSKVIGFSHKKESIIEGTTHLKPIENGILVLILEDFFDDFEKACKKLILLNNKGELPTKKNNEDYIVKTSIR